MIAQVNPIPNLSIASIWFDPFHPGKAWKSAECWCADTILAAAVALATAACLSVPVGAAAQAGAPAALQWGLVALGCAASYGVLRKFPKLSGRALDIPGAYAALRCELIQILIEADPDGSAAVVRVVHNGEIVWIPIEAARESPWDALRRMPGIAGQRPDAPVPRKIQDMIADTLRVWERFPEKNRQHFIGRAP